jgi:hypothetical protein
MQGDENMKNDINKNQTVGNQIRRLEMKMTKHANTRKSQRGFSKFVMDIILTHGKYKDARGGAMRVFFGKKEYQNIVTELKRAIQLMDKAKGGSIIIAEDKIITLYKG